MKLPLALLVLAFVPSARAQTPKKAAVTEPKSKVVELADFYYYDQRRNSGFANIVNRSALVVPSYSEYEPYLVCLVPPAADWIASGGASPEVEKQYLTLLRRVAWADQEFHQSAADGFSGRKISLCGVYRYPLSGSVKRINEMFLGPIDKPTYDRTHYSSCRGAQTMKVAGHPKYASKTAVDVTPLHAIGDTIKLLLASKTPETVRDALWVARSYMENEEFAPAIAAVVRDKSVVAKVLIKRPPEEGGNETIPLRVFAMQTLATTQPTALVGLTLASVFKDDTETPEIRAGAIRAYGYFMSWPIVGRDANIQAKGTKAQLRPLLSIFDGEEDKKEEAGPSGKLSELGLAASCVGHMYPQEMVKKVKAGQEP